MFPRVMTKHPQLDPPFLFGIFLGTLANTLTPFLNRRQHIVIEKVIGFFLFIGCIGVTLVNTVIQVSGAQSHSTSSVHCAVCSLPKSGVRPSPFTPPCPAPPAPAALPWHHTVVHAIGLFPFGGGGGRGRLNSHKLALGQAT